MALQTAIDLPPVPDRQQMNSILFQVESINDPVVTDADTETIRSFQLVVRIRRQAQSDFID